MPHPNDLDYACLAQSPCYLRLKGFAVMSVQEMNLSGFGLHPNLKN